MYLMSKTRMILFIYLECPQNIPPKGRSANPFMVDIRQIVSLVNITIYVSTIIDINHYCSSKNRIHIKAIKSILYNQTKCSLFKLLKTKLSAYSSTKMLRKQVIRSRNERLVYEQ